METAVPLVSVITVTFNAESSIEATLSSVVAQKGDFEWILMDGGSTDRTLALADEMSAGLSRTIVSERDNGLYDAMNKGLKLARGRYVIFMNSGDAFVDGNVLFDFTNLIARSTVSPAMVYGHTRVEFHDGNSFKRAVRPLSYIQHGQPTIHQSVFFDRLLHLGTLYPYKEYGVSADYAVMARLQTSHSEQIFVWDRDVSVFRNDPKSASNRHIGRRVADAWRVQKEILGLPILPRFLSALRRLAAVPYYNMRPTRRQ